MLLLTTAAGVQYGVYVRQQSAIADIERLGGRVVATQGGPVWLRRLAGSEAMQISDRATLVKLSDTEITDADLVHLMRLRGVERLNLSGTRITDAGLVHVGRLSGLKALDLSGTEVSDAGLVHLARLSDLEYLYLDDTRVSDGGLKHLKNLDRLRHLSSEGTVR